MIFWFEIVALSLVTIGVLAKLKSWRLRGIWFVLMWLPFALPLSLALMVGCHLSAPNGCYDVGWALIVALGAEPIWLLLLALFLWLRSVTRGNSGKFHHDPLQRGPTADGDDHNPPIVDFG